MALSKLPSVGYLFEKLNRHCLQIWLLGTALLSQAKAQTVSEVTSLIKEGKLEEARSLTAQWENGSASSDAQLFLKAIVTPDGDQAAVVYEALINRFPDSGYRDDALFRLGQWRYADGLYLSSRQQFRRLILDHPRSPLVQKSLYWIGLTYQAAGNADSARYFLNKTIGEEPRSETADLANNPQERLENNTRTGSQPPSPSPPEPKIRYAVQVGAFTQQNGALLRKAFFEREGFDVRLRTKKKDDSLFYLVWVGAFDTADEARALGIRLNRKYGISSTLVSE